MFPFSNIFAEIGHRRRLLLAPCPPGTPERVWQMQQWQHEADVRALQTKLITKPLHPLVKLFASFAETPDFFFLLDEFSQALRRWRGPRMESLQQRRDALLVDNQFLKFRTQANAEKVCLSRWHNARKRMGWGKGGGEGPTTNVGRPRGEERGEPHLITRVSQYGGCGFL